VFTPEERGRLRDTLITAAHADERVTGAALTGSASLGAEDVWSDVDLALGIAPEADLTAVITDWTGTMYRDHRAVHHTDVISGATTYRVFLLASTLQSPAPCKLISPSRQRQSSVRPRRHSASCSAPQPTGRCHRR
jgi:hypothetical protein